MEKIKILEFQPEFAPDFKDLNVEWLEKYFEVEKHDVEQLDNPNGILANGGHIYFANLDGKNVGTATLIKEGENAFELAKMAVTESAKGKGIGNILMEHCLAEVRKLGAEKVILLSNRNLTPAISLYEKYGFVEVPITENPYARGNIKMEKVL